jgi:hypothetical protein
LDDQFAANLYINGVVTRWALWCRDLVTALRTEETTFQVVLHVKADQSRGIGAWEDEIVSGKFQRERTMVMVGKGEMLGSLTFIFHAVPRTASDNSLTMPQERPVFIVFLIGRSALLGTCEMRSSEISLSQAFEALRIDELS